jgi:hypothetical protein
MKWRRLLLCLLFALSFDAVVPFEPTAAGTLQLDDDLEEAAQLRERRDHARDTRAATRARASPAQLMGTHRISVPPSRVREAVRREAFARPPLASVDPGTAPPPGGDDH